MIYIDRALGAFLSHPLFAEFLCLTMENCDFRHPVNFPTSFLRFERYATRSFSLLYFLESTLPGFPIFNQTIWINLPTFLTQTLSLLSVGHGIWLAHFVSSIACGPLVSLAQWHIVATDLLYAICYMPILKHCLCLGVHDPDFVI